MANFEQAYPKTRIYEGGWADVAGDRGGKTYIGITEVFQPDWRGWSLLKKYLPLKYGQIVNDPELDKAVKEFYKKEKWDKIWGDKIISQRVAEFIYDYTIHSGLRGVKAAQKCIGGLTVDGIMGPKTLNAINAANAEALFSCMKTERLNFLIALSKQPGQAKFKQGWINRVNSFV